MHGCCNTDILHTCVYDENYKVDIGGLSTDVSEWSDVNDDLCLCSMQAVTLCIYICSVTMR